LGKRVELKNINSFRFVERAIDSEIARQTALLQGGKQVAQETRSFDPKTGKTASLRSKEDADDYRYFPDPDLPPLRIEASLVQAQRELIGELPEAVRRRYAQLGLSSEAAQTLCRHPADLEFFEGVLKGFSEPVAAANFVVTEVMRGAKQEGLKANFSVTPEQVAELLSLVQEKRISGKQAKEVFAAIEGSERRAGEIVAERGMKIVADEGPLLEMLRELMRASPKQVAALKGGKQAMAGFFVGQVMKATGGSADPKLVSDLLQKLLLEEPS
jgi:aspartyl-tRNA(Asn)/glutamyl-tRNA(Gln) amidotransferase subunit B